MFDITLKLCIMKNMKFEDYDVFNDPCLTKDKKTEFSLIEYLFMILATIFRATMLTFIVVR
jgi:hypothetical protein